jgi:hypothetical protein
MAARTKREAQRAPREDEDPRDRYRPLCTGFKFWRVCGKECVRAKACAGDSRACFDRFWPLIGERHRVWFRAAVKARIAGLSVAEANARADAETERAAEHIARVDAETDARVRAEDAARARTSPRLRGEVASAASG